MGIIIGALLALLAIGVVIYPFVKSRRRQEPSRASGPGMTRAEEAAFNEIRTLQLERELGRVDEEEYRDRLKDYRVRAASLLRERDIKFKEADAELEAEILAARSAAENHRPNAEESTGPQEEAPGSHENNGKAS